MSLAIAVIILALSLCFGAGLSAQPAQETGAVGETQVMKWKDGKKAVFLLAYDDSCPSHITNAIPELEKRNLVGTFYINAGNGPYKSREADWQKVAKSPAVVLGNHTFTHVGATAADQLDTELARANEVIFSLAPRKQPRIVSFAQPGGVPWKVEKEVVKELLAKHNLVQRPPFNGPPLSHKTLAEGMKIVDAAIEKGEMGHIDFHGVGGDWHVAPMDYYIPLLDRLQAESAQLWVTDHATYHKYATERKSAQVTLAAADKAAIRLTLSAADTDPTLYDEPLTLRTRIPADWTVCSVTQGETRSQARVANGFAQYEAIPGPEAILLQPMK